MTENKALDILTLWGENKGAKEEEAKMKTIFKRVGKLFFGLRASSFGIAMFLTAVPLMAGWGGRGGGCTRVAEPASVLLLGAGLVSLAVYAKKKNGKK